MIPRDAAARRLLPVVGPVLGALAVWVAETWLWAGQPSGDPTDAQVHTWYVDHALRVIAGDVLWAAACVVLVRTLWVLAARHSPSLRRWVRAGAVASGASLAASAVIAAAIAADVSPLDDRTAWDLEGTCFLVGAALLAGCLLLHAGADRVSLPTTISQVLAAVLLLVPGQAVIGLAVAFAALAWETANTVAGLGHRAGSNAPDPAVRPVRNR